MKLSRVFRWLPTLFRRLWELSNAAHDRVEWWEIGRELRRKGLL